MTRSDPDLWPIVRVSPPAHSNSHVMLAMSGISGGALYTENDPLAVLQETWQRRAQIPIRDSRPVDEILGYGEDGLLT